MSIFDLILLLNLNVNLRMMMEFYVCHPNGKRREKKFLRFLEYLQLLSLHLNESMLHNNTSKPRSKLKISISARERRENHLLHLFSLIFHHLQREPMLFCVLLYYSIIFGISIGNLTNKRLRKIVFCWVLFSLRLRALFSHCITNCRLHVVFNFSR